MKATRDNTTLPAPRWLEAAELAAELMREIPGICYDLALRQALRMVDELQAYAVEWDAAAAALAGGAQ